MGLFKPSLLAAILCISILSWAQEAAVSGGNFHRNATESISWGVGEAVIETFTALNNITTQGFQQTKLTLTSVEEIPGMDHVLSAYPNPSHDFINPKVDGDDLKGLRYELFNLNGRVPEQGAFENNPLAIISTICPAESIYLGYYPMAKC